MSSLIISGDTSGAVTLAAPAVAGTTTLTLQANTGTLALQTDVIGFSQTWQVNGSGITRVSGTTYYNTTGKPIQCFITCNQTLTPTITVNGTNIISGLGSTATYVTYAFIVPPGGSYSASTSSFWAELR